MYTIYMTHKGTTTDINTSIYVNGNHIHFKKCLCLFGKITRFPCALKYKEQWEMWTSNVKVTKPGFVPRRTKYLNRLCSKHFEPELIIRTDKRAALTPGAVPTIFYTAKQVNFLYCQVLHPINFYL